MVSFSGAQCPGLIEAWHSPPTARRSSAPFPGHNAPASLKHGKGGPHEAYLRPFSGAQCPGLIEAPVAGECLRRPAGAFSGAQCPGLIEALSQAP